ncbi:hypothetical protein SeMB42_g02302 [Synchytrium endobioticum]|uniref:Uncharacterized protein n=1 Tax=Synchytrium endobioticum TaxID=286115 RepID=A0A507DG50_9FUNG|nr:hypothetical protein SeMB42_g02302 [Synchytrium endobioticum]
MPGSEITSVFKFQRLEPDAVFGEVITAESCHFISKQHCQTYPAEYSNNNSLCIMQGVNRQKRHRTREIEIWRCLEFFNPIMQKVYDM